MERGVDKGLIAAWRWMAGFAIFPVTVIPGFHAVILLISSFCVFLDCWSLEGAMTNLSLGLPATAGMTALWISTLLPLAVTVRTRFRFVLVTTGLLTGIVLECLLLRAELGGDLSRLSKVGLFQACVFGCPWAMAVVNLLLLIRTRELLLRPPTRIIAEEIKTPVRRRVIPSYHLRSAPELRPVILQPYRPPVSTWSYYDETMFD